MEWNAKPLDWYKLIHEAEIVRAWWGPGLASVWEPIHKGDYGVARAEMDRVIESVASGQWGPPKAMPRTDDAVFSPQHWSDVITKAGVLQ